MAGEFWLSDEQFVRLAPLLRRTRAGWRGWMIDG